jgi:hypothetical protein
MSAGNEKARSIRQDPHLERSREARVPGVAEPKPKREGAYQGNFATDISGRRIRQGRLLEGVNRGLDRIIDQADRDADGETARLVNEMIDAFRAAWNNRRKDPDLVANLAAAWAVKGHPDLPRDLNAKWRALFQWVHSGVRGKSGSGRHAEGAAREPARADRVAPAVGLKSRRGNDPSPRGLEGVIQDHRAGTAQRPLNAAGTKRPFLRPC